MYAAFIWSKFNMEAENELGQTLYMEQIDVYIVETAQAKSPAKNVSANAAATYHS